MMILSTLIGSLSGAAGIYLSFYVDIASGASIILLQATLFVCVLIYAAWKNRRS